MQKNETLLRAILDIIGRGNTAEVKQTKDGVLVLEVKRKVAFRETETEYRRARKRPGIRAERS